MLVRSRILLKHKTHEVSAEMCRIIFSDKNNWLIRQARRQGGWGVRSVRSHPPPRAKKVRLEVTCSAENVNL